MVTKKFVDRLSRAQRQMLVAHVPCDEVTAEIGPTRRALLDMDLLCAAKPGIPDSRIRTTRLTIDGREAAAIVLGEYADALVAAGYLEAEIRPLDILADLRKRGRHHAQQATPLDPEPDIPPVDNLLQKPLASD